MTFLLRAVRLTLSTQKCLMKTVFPCDNPGLAGLPYAYIFQVVNLNDQCYKISKLRCVMLISIFI